VHGQDSDILHNRKRLLKLGYPSAFWKPPTSRIMRFQAGKKNTLRKAPRNCGHQYAQLDYGFPSISGFQPA
jgi:hypothetical protein